MPRHHATCSCGEPESARSCRLHRSTSLAASTRSAQRLSAAALIAHSLRARMLGFRRAFAAAFRGRLEATGLTEPPLRSLTTSAARCERQRRSPTLSRAQLARAREDAAQRRALEALPVPALLTLIEQSAPGDWYQQATRIQVARERGERVDAGLIRAILHKLALSVELRTVDRSFERCLAVGLRLHSALEALFAALRDAEPGDFDMAMRAVRACGYGPGAKLLRAEMARRDVEPSTDALVDALETFDRWTRLDWSADSATDQARACRPDVEGMVATLLARSVDDEVRAHVGSLHLRIHRRTKSDRKLFGRLAREYAGIDPLRLNPFEVTSIAAADLETCIGWLGDEGRLDSAIAAYETLRSRIRADEDGVGALAAAQALYAAAIQCGNRLVACHYLDALVEADKRPRRVLREAMMAGRAPRLSAALDVVADKEVITAVEAGGAVTAAIRALLEAIQRRRFFGTGQLRARHVLMNARETVRGQQRRLAAEREWHVATAKRSSRSTSAVVEALAGGRYRQRVAYGLRDFCGQLWTQHEALAQLNRELKQHRFKLMTDQSHRSLVADPVTGRSRVYRADSADPVEAIKHVFQNRYAERINKRRRAYFKKRVRAMPQFSGYLARFRPAGTGRTAGCIAFRRATPIWRPLQPAVRRRIARRKAQQPSLGQRIKRDIASVDARSGFELRQRIDKALAYRRQAVQRQRGVTAQLPRSDQQIARRRRALQDHLGAGEGDVAVKKMRKWRSGGHAPTLRPPWEHAATRAAEKARYRAWRFGGVSEPAATRYRSA